MDKNQVETLLQTYRALWTVLSLPVPRKTGRATSWAILILIALVLPFVAQPAYLAPMAPIYRHHQTPGGRQPVPLRQRLMRLMTQVALNVDEDYLTILA